MSKRLLLMSCVALAVTIVVVSKFKPSDARAATTVMSLQPIRSFQVPGLAGLRLSDVATYNDDLYLLLGDGHSVNEIAHVSSTGEMLTVVPLPTPPDSTKQRYFTHIRISSTGTMAVSLPHFGPTGSGMTVFLYDTAGHLKYSFDGPLVDEIAFLGDDLVGVGSTGFIRLTSQSQFVSDGATLAFSVLDPSMPVMTASLPQDKLAVVEIVAGRLQVATMTGLSVAPNMLSAPEIQGVNRPVVENGWAAVISTVTANEMGDLYLGVTGGKRQEGAPVLQFDSGGVLKSRIKCMLPTFGQDPSNHMSYMYPGKLLATNDLLFWISMSEKKIAVYSNN